MGVVCGWVHPLTLKESKSDKLRTQSNGVAPQKARHITCVPGTSYWCGDSRCAMRLDATPSQTGALYKNTDNANNPIPIAQAVPEQLTPSNGDCMYAAIHRMYSAWQRSYPNSFQQMRADLQTFCDRNDNFVELPVATGVPASPDDPPTEPELSELQKWRKIAARQLELHWERYDFTLPGDLHSQRGEVDDALRWLHNPSPNDGPSDVALRGQLQQLLGDQPGGLPPADSQDPEQRKRAMVAMTAKAGVYAYGIELDALAEVLGIFISTWFYSDPNPLAWVGAEQYRVHGPSGEQARDIAMRYVSGGYVPRFNLIKSQNHYSYQAVAYSGVANDRTKVQGVRFYDGGNGGDPTETDNDPSQPGELNPQVVGGVRAHSGPPAGGGGGGGGGGDDDGGYGYGGPRALYAGSGRAQFKTVAPGACQIRGDAFSELEWQYANKKLAEAHERFFEHYATRLNYGKIMLMVDDDIDVIEAADTSGADSGGGGGGGQNPDPNPAPKPKLKAKPKQVDQGMVKSKGSQSSNTAHGRKDDNEAVEAWYEQQAMQYKALMKKVQTEGTFLMPGGKVTKFKDVKDVKRTGGWDGFRQSQLILRSIVRKRQLNAQGVALLWVSLCRWWRRWQTKIGTDNQTRKQTKAALSHIFTWIRDGERSKVDTNVGLLFNFLEAACEFLEKEEGFNLNGPPGDGELVIPDDITEWFEKPAWDDVRPPPRS